MEISVYLFWPLFLLAIYIIIFPLSVLLYRWLDMPAHKTRQVWCACFKTSSWTNLIISIIVFLIAFICSRNSVSRIYVVNSDDSVSENIIAGKFNSQYFVRNNSQHNLLEVSVEYGIAKSISFFPTERRISLIQPDQTVLLSKKPWSIMKGIPDAL